MSKNPKPIKPVHKLDHPMRMAILAILTILFLYIGLPLLVITLITLVVKGIIAL